MTSAYRDDIGAAEQLLARLEATYVEREVWRLHELRRATASATRPPPSFWGHVLRALALLLVFVGWPALMLHADHAVSARWPYVEMPSAPAGVASVFGPFVVVAVALKYLAWEHRRDKRMALAEIDAELAAVQNAPRRIEAPTLEDVRTRIAELEAEEASFSGQAEERRLVP